MKQGFPDGSVVKKPPANAGDMGTWTGSLGWELHYSCLENPWTEESGMLQSWGCKQSDTT